MSLWIVVGAAVVLAVLVALAVAAVVVKSDKRDVGGGDQE